LYRIKVRIVSRSDLPEGQMLKTETLNLRVSVEFKRRLIEEARRERRSVTNYIEAVITELWSHKARTK
jgi:predicted HicB family RNase H-like nuclease